MAITIDYATFIINIPKADTQLVQSSPTEIRSLDLNTFRLTLKDLEDDELGMPFLHTHNHNPPVTVGGVTLARVIEIINGYTITFEDGQYAVNLVGANSNVGDVVNVNQVSIRSANSAGLTYSKQVEDLSFADQRVWINIDTGLPGTIYPRGTISDPVSNLADAQDIVSARNLPLRLNLTGTMVLLPSDDISNYDIEGGTAILSSLDVAVGANTQNLILSRLSITGDLNGNIVAEDAVSFRSIIDFDGVMIRCALAGTINLGTGGVGKLHLFSDCISESAGMVTPIINCNSLAELDVQFRRYSGGLKIQNFDTPNSNISIDLTAGSVTLESTCTDGTIVIRGVGNLNDNSGVGCTVITDGLLDPFESEESLLQVEKILRNKFVTDPVTGIATLYDNDGVTPLLVGQLYEDAPGTQTYRGRGAERRERLE